MKTYSDTFEPIPNPTRPNTDIQSETDLRDYLESAFTVEDLRHALYNEREKTSQAIRKLVAQRDELLAALKALADEVQLARKYIVLDDDNGLSAYHATGKAWKESKDAIAKCDASNP